jgi:hypothetical protein
MRVGIVGYSAQKFDSETAMELLYECLIELEINDDQQASSMISFIVSGLTNLGMPKLCYQFAKERKIPTMGIACAKANQYDCFPCDRVHIIGNEWGDESEAFLASIDVLIRIGGGNQSKAESARAKERGILVIERELAAII